jgi:hypothetical protein
MQVGHLINPTPGVKSIRVSLNNRVKKVLKASSVLANPNVLPHTIMGVLLVIDDIQF